MRTGIFRSHDISESNLIACCHSLGLPCPVLSTHHSYVSLYGEGLSKVTFHSVLLVPTCHILSWESVSLLICSFTGVV